MPPAGPRNTDLPARPPAAVALRLLWALPCSALGALGAVAVLLAGGRAQRFGRVIEVCPRDGSALARLWSRRSPFTAITFGHVVLGESRAALARLRVHERVHVAQYERWGPLFLLAYPAASAWAWLRGRRPYRDNAFERPAFAAEQAHRARRAHPARPHAAAGRDGGVPLKPPSRRPPASR